MSDTQPITPYIPHNPGDLITAEDWNDMQIAVRSDLAANAAADDQRAAELRDMIANVDAKRFGGQTPDEWTENLDKRYVRRDDPGAAGQYRRYFKQLNRQVVPPGGGLPVIEPCVIEHNLCRFPLVDLYELQPLFRRRPDNEFPEAAAGMQNVKFLIYYASKRDPVAELLFTESRDRFYYGDDLTLLLQQFQLTPALTQKFDDLVNDLFGKMFDPGDEQDQFNRENYAVSPYVQAWIDRDQTVGDLMKGGQWTDLRLAIRPAMIPALAQPMRRNVDEGGNAEPEITYAQVFHLSQNAVEIRVPAATDLMVILRT